MLTASFLTTRDTLARMSRQLARGLLLLAALPMLTNCGGGGNAASPRGVADSIPAPAPKKQRVRVMTATVGPSSSIAYYNVPGGSGTYPTGITVGSNGNLWFTEYRGQAVSSISTAGTFGTPYTVENGPDLIVGGPSGNNAVWLTVQNGNAIAEVTTSGQVQQWNIPCETNTEPTGMTLGPDGNLWFTLANANEVGYSTPWGSLQMFQVPTANAKPWVITPGPDGRLWFTEFGADQIGAITTAGTVTEYGPIPTANAEPYGIVQGGDGNLWFTEYNGTNVGRITPTGSITEIPTKRPITAEFANAVLGPDGNVWFAEFQGNAIDYVTTGSSPQVQNYASLPGNAHTLVVGPDGNIWFTLQNIGEIGKIPFSSTPGSGWQDTGQAVTEVAAGTGNSALAVSTTAVSGGGYAVLQYNGSSWSSFGPSSYGALRVSESPDGTPWSINATNNMFKWNGTAWVQQGGADTFTDVTGRPSNTANALSTTKETGGYKVVYYYDSTFTLVGSQGMIQVSSPNNVNAYGLDSSNDIWSWTGTAWTSWGTGAISIAAGPNGDMWRVDTTADPRGGYTLSYYSGGSWQTVDTSALPSGVTQVSVGPSDMPFVVTSTGEVFQRT